MDPPGEFGSLDLVEIGSALVLDPIVGLEHVPSLNDREVSRHLGVSIVRYLMVAGFACLFVLFFKFMTFEGLAQNNGYKKISISR